MWERWKELLDEIRNAMDEPVPLWAFLMAFFGGCVLTVAIVRAAKPLLVLRWCQ